MTYFELEALLIAYSPSTKFSNLGYLLYINIPRFFFLVQQPKSEPIVNVSRSLSLKQTRSRAHALGLLSTSVQLFAEAATYTTSTRDKRP